jgi:hypothetical protein
MLRGRGRGRVATPGASEPPIAGRQEVVRQLLTMARAQLDTLADALLSDETVREDALVRMLGARPGPLPLPAL